MKNFSRFCFVCDVAVDSEKSTIHKQLNLPVCNECKGTERENEKVKELLEGMADGFVCGCI